MPDPHELGRGEIGPPEQLTWQQLGACRGLDPTIFYPDEYDEALEAKAVCEQCCVRMDCLEFALVTRQKYGVWGGATESERRRLIRQRRRHGKG